MPQRNGINIGWREAKLIRRLRREASVKQGHRCFHCGKKMTYPKPSEGNSDPRRVTADHYPIPRAAGGQTEADNIVAACMSCNSSNGSRFLIAPKNGDSAVSASNVVVEASVAFDPFPGASASGEKDQDQASGQ